MFNFSKLVWFLESSQDPSYKLEIFENIISELLKRIQNRFPYLGIPEAERVVESFLARLSVQY